MLITDDFLPVPVPESLSATYLVPTAGLPSVTARTAVGTLAGGSPSRCTGWPGRCWTVR